jgi:hypothetical protein
MEFEGDITIIETDEGTATIIEIDDGPTLTIIDATTEE